MSLYNKESGYGRHTQSYPFNGGGQVFVVARSAAAGRQIMQDTFKGFDGVNRYFATVDAAINATTANRGDMIFVCPNHTETFTAAAGFALDVAGVSVIGLGSGNNRPVFTISSTNNSGTITQSGNNTVLKNIVVVTNDDELTNAVVVSGDNCYTEFEHQDTSSAVEAATVVRGDTANNWTLKLKHLGFTAGNAMVSTVRLDDCDNVDITVDAYGIMTTAIVEMVDVASTNVKVRGNFYVSGTTNLSKNVVDTITGSTWWVDGFDGAAGAAFSGGSGNAVAVGDLSAIASDVTTIKGNVGGTDSATNVLGADNNNNTFATTNVAANEDGTVLERLEQLQEAVNRGTGTSLAANESLADVLYAANGIAAFPSSAAPANGVSIAEVLREVYDQEEKAVTNTTATLVNGTTIFTIAGGPIEIISLVARCVTANDGTASTLQWSADPTDGAAATFSAASASLANVAAGGMVILQGTSLATAPIVNATGVGLGQTVTNGIVIGAGIITTTIGVGSTTGTWQHHMRYKPLARGVTVS